MGLTVSAACLPPTQTYTVSLPTFPAARLPNKAHLQSKKPKQNKLKLISLVYPLLNLTRDCMNLQPTCRVEASPGAAAVNADADHEDALLQPLRCPFRTWKYARKTTQVFRRGNWRWLLVASESRHHAGDELLGAPPAHPGPTAQGSLPASARSPCTQTPLPPRARRRATLATPFCRMQNDMPDEEQPDWEASQMRKV